MKKKFIYLLFIVFIITIFLPKQSEEFRIRVIAASDSAFDQSQKHEVVRVLKKEINKLDADNIINEIKENIDLLEVKVKELLAERSFSIKITKVNFPTKELEGRVISGGKYQTLLVVIGNGEGKNWWSILYPEYHNISFEDIETKEVEFEFYFWKKIKEFFE